MQITHYAAIAVIAFAVSMLTTAQMIPFLRKKQFGQFIREDGPQAHLSKAGTPTMGGIAMVLGITVALIVSSFITGRFGPEKLAILLSMYAFGLVGFIDDFNKIAKRQNEGLTPKQKLALQLLFGLALAVFMMVREGTSVLIPFVGITVDFGILYIPFIVFVEVAMANSVNLTDGLDGLASSTSSIVAACFAVIGMFVLPGGNEPMAAAAQAVFGATLGFLVYNHYPARIFMGDTGSFVLGTGYAAAVLVCDLPYFGVLALGVPIVSVIVSLLHRAHIIKLPVEPLHHTLNHYGMSETKIVYSYWAITAILCIIGILLKMYVF